MTAERKYGIIPGDKDEKEMNTYNVIVHSAEEGGYWAEVPDLPGCATEGDTLDELAANVREAISLYLKDETAEVRHSSLMQVSV